MLSESPMVKPPESKSEPSSTQSDLNNSSSNLPWKPSVELKTNSQEDKKSSFPTSGASPNLLDWSSKNR